MYIFQRRRRWPFPGRWLPPSLTRIWPKPPRWMQSPSHLAFFSLSLLKLQRLILMILFDQYTKNCDMKKDEAKRLSINRFCRGSGMVPRAILNLGIGSFTHDTWLTRVLSSNMGPTKDKNRFVCYWIPSSPFGLLRSNYSVPMEEHRHVVSQTESVQT